MAVFGVSAFGTAVFGQQTIADFQATSIGATQITVTWSTPTLSDSQVDWGGSTSYGWQTPLQPAMVTAHTVVLTGLVPASTYHLRARSRDASGTLLLSGDLAVTTATPLGRTWTWIEPNGSAHVFDPSIDPDLRVIQGAKGYGDPPTQWIEDRVPQHDGPIMRDVLYDAREIEVPLLVTSPDYTSLQTKMRTMRQWLNVKKGDGTLQLTDPDGTIRQYTCRLKQGLEGAEGQDVGGPTWRKVVLVFRTSGSDPYAHFSSALTYTYQQAAASATWFPIFPLVLGGAGIFASMTITNPGDFEAEPIWTLVGPMTNPVLTNVTTNAKISLTTALLAGQSIVIDTRFRVKSILRNDGTKLFSALSNDSSLWTLVPGQNAATIVASGTTTASQVQLSFTPRTL